MHPALRPQEAALCTIPRAAPAGGPSFAWAAGRELASKPIAATLTSEGDARGTRCPPRQSWDLQAQGGAKGAEQAAGGPGRAAALPSLLAHSSSRAERAEGPSSNRPGGGSAKGFLDSEHPLPGAAPCDRAGVGLRARSSAAGTELSPPPPSSRPWPQAGEGRMGHTHCHCAVSPENSPWPRAWPWGSRGHFLEHTALRPG